MSVMDIDICQTCLCKDRILYAVCEMETILKELHFLQMNNTRGGICWECRQRVKNIWRFKNQVLEAQTVLYSNLEIKYTGSLSIKTNKDFDYQFIYNEDPLKHAESVMKNELNIIKEEQEIREEDDNNPKFELPEDSISNSSEKLGCKEENEVKDLFDDSFEEQRQIGIDKNVISKVKKKLTKARKIPKDGRLDRTEQDIESDIIKKKFTVTVLTEEELLRYREEKRRQPNYKKIPFKCDSCVLGFTRKENYDLHMKKKHDESIGQYTCKVCATRFSSAASRSRHVRAHYSRYGCRLCAHATRGRAAAAAHARRKHAADARGEIHCDRCGYVARSTMLYSLPSLFPSFFIIFSNINIKLRSTRLPSAASRSRHVRAHYSRYGCRLCAHATRGRAAAAAHARRKHAADARGEIHCDSCGYVARTPEELSEHARTQHVLYCNECGEKFKGKHTLRTHKIRIHRSNRAFACDICRRTFKSRSRLESHAATHASLARSLAYCAQCRVQYKSVHVYRHHLRNSARHAERAHQCPDCNKKFASKVYWKKHCDFYHRKKSQFKCEACNKLFISDWRLKNHIETHHGTNRTRNHTCKECGKKFFTQSTLRAHYLTHSSERSYMCEQCGDTFKQRAALHTHTRALHAHTR